MRAGGLRHSRIEIQQNVETTSKSGARQYRWATMITTNADIDFRSGARKLDMHEMTNTYTVDFRIRKYHVVNEKMRILYAGNKYAIQAILPSIDKQMQTIVAKNSNE